MKHREKKRNDDEAMMAMMVKSSTQANDKVPAKCQSEWMQSTLNIRLDLFRLRLVVCRYFFCAVFVPPCLFWDMNKDFELPKKAHHCYSTHQRHQHQCYCFRLRGKKTIVQFRHNVNIGNSGNIYTCSSGLLLELHHTHTFSSSIFLSFFMGSLFLVSLKLLLFLLLFKIAEKKRHTHIQKVIPANRWYELFGLAILAKECEQQTEKER